MAWHCNKIFFIFIGPSSEVIKLQKEASDLKKEREELTKLLKNLEKDKSAWQKQSDDLNNLKKEQSSIKKDKDALTQNLKTMERWKDLCRLHLLFISWFPSTWMTWTLQKHEKQKE